MNRLDLNAYGVVEMDADQLHEIDGGAMAAVWWFVGALAYDILSNWSDSAASFQNGYNYVLNM